MAQFLALQIKLGKITLDQVPDKYKEDVEEILNSDI